MAETVVVLGELLYIVSEAIARYVNFKENLTHLSDTLKALGPKIQEIQKLNNELGRQKEELQSLLSLMEDGKQLVRDCSQIRRINLVARTRYEKKLQVLIESLNRFITIDLQVQNARDQKETLLHVRNLRSSVDKPSVYAKPKEDATASSSHDSTTPLLVGVSESEIYGSTTGTWTNSYPEKTIEQEEQLELSLSCIVNSSSFTYLSAQSSTNGIDANAVIHKKREVIVRGSLSVTVISAENLSAVDFMRKSDPFVILTLRKAKSKAETKYKTKVVNNCLNPFWNQTFDFVVEDGSHDELIVEVWDRHTFGEDSMGKCRLSLNKVILEEEYEERFKLVGAESSYLKLHLKWRHQPIYCDSNFLQPTSIGDLELKRVGILKVKLLQAKELTNKHIIRKSDPFAVLYIQASGDREKKSETISNDLNPIWNEKLEFIIEDVFTEHLIVEVNDSKHLWSSKLIGCAQIRLSELQPGKVKYVWSKLFKPLEIQRDNKNIGEVHVELLYCPFGMENSFTKPLAPNCSMASLEEVREGSANGIEANGNENAVTEREKEVIIRGILSVTVISAEDLPALDFMGKSDPFVVLTLRKAKSKEEIRHKTKVVNQSLNPVWKETFPFVVEDGLHDMVIVEVWDKDTFGKDYIGRCILSLTKVILEGEYTHSFDLVGAKSGSLELHLKWRF